MLSHPESYKTSRTICVEEHFVTPGYLEGPGRQLASQMARQPQMVRVAEQLRDLGDQRIAEMNEAGIDVQVLSLNTPGVQQLEASEAVALAREANDWLAAAVQRHPQRLAGLAALPTADPEAGARELERMVDEHGFKGAIVNGHTRGRYLDDPFFWPVLERAEALHVPIYLHPTEPPAPIVAASYSGNFSPAVTFALSTSLWGWHIETATHILRVILGGVFDRFPQLQFMIGHMGEGLPFFLQRFDHRLPPAATRLERPISAYLRENIFYTFGGFNFTATFLDLLLQVGVERILFSADYPYASMASARSFLEQLPISAADRERIAHGNAEALLGPIPFE